MKKTRLHKLSLHRETLHRLMNEDLSGIHGAKEQQSTADWCSVPSCIDGCVTAMCPTTLAIDGRG